MFLCRVGPLFQLSSLEIRTILVGTVKFGVLPLFFVIVMNNVVVVVAAAAAEALAVADSL